MAAQSLASLLVHAGFEKVDAKLKERNLRFSLLYESMLENKNLIERIAVKIIALVLDHDTPRASHQTASQLQVPKYEHLGLPGMMIKETMFGDSSLSASAHSEMPPVTTVAQQAILAIHVRLHDKPVFHCFRNLWLPHAEFDDLAGRLSDITAKLFCSLWRL